jgi:hypothetical protein
MKKDTTFLVVPKSTFHHGSVAYYTSAIPYQPDITPFTSPSFPRYASVTPGHQLPDYVAVKSVRRFALLPFNIK